MAFQISDYYDLVELLRQKPEWREELRQLLLTPEVLTLPQVVRELAEAHKRSEERLTRLEQVVAELAEAQKRTEQRVEELAEAQKRTEQRVNNLAEELQKTRSEVAKLTSVFGATLEEEAASVLKAVMRRKGYRLLSEEARLAWNGEVDVILLVETPQGRRLSVVAEAKARLSEQDVRHWERRVTSEGWQKHLQATGCSAPYVLYFYAIRADVGAQEALKEKGMGLLKSEGEVIPPGTEFGG